MPPHPPMATPLYDVPEVADTLGRMPHFDQWGPFPLGTVRDNPCPFRMIGEEVLKLEDEGIDPLQASVNPLAGRNARVILSRSSSEEGQGVDTAVVRAPHSSPRTQPILALERPLIGLGTS